MNDGDFIRLDYNMRVGEDKKLVSTSDEKVAKDNDIFDDKVRYRPIVVIVGTDQVFKKIDESFKTAEVGKEVEIAMTPEESYGKRDPKNIKIHSYIEFKRQNIDPVPGQEVFFNQRRGRILSVTPGRVLVDYNPPHAGKDVLYAYTVKEVLSDPKDKVLALIDMNYPLRDGVFDVSVDGTAIRIGIPEESKFDPVWVEAKFRIVNDIRKYFPEDTTSIVETYTPVEEAKANEATESPAPAESKDETVSETPPVSPSDKNENPSTENNEAEKEKQEEAGADENQRKEEA